MDNPGQHSGSEEALRRAVASGRTKVIALLEAGGGRPLKAGADLSRLWRESSGIFRLKSGWAFSARYMPVRRMIADVFVAGDLIGLDGIGGGRSDCSIVMLTSGFVERLERSTLLAAAEKSSDVSAYLVHELAACAMRKNSSIVVLGRGTSEERIAYLVVNLFDRLPTSGSHGLPKFELPMTQEQIADCVGISMIHVNRCLRRFREAGVLNMHGKTVTILDLPRLRALVAPLVDG